MLLCCQDSYQVRKNICLLLKNLIHFYLLQLQTVVTVVLVSFRQIHRFRHHYMSQAPVWSGAATKMHIKTQMYLVSSVGIYII